MLPVVIIGIVSSFVWLAWELKNASEEPETEDPLAEIRRHNWECWTEEIREDIPQPWRLKL